MDEVWAEMQAQVEELTGQAGLQILRAVLENEVTRRVGPPHRPNPTAGCVRWGKQPGYVVFAGQKIPLERPRIRTREGQEVELESYGQLQQDGKLQRAVRERMVAGLSTRNYRRAVESVVEGYGIAKSSVSRQFVEASSNQLRVLCERRLEDLNLVVLMIDGIHFGGQVLVVALGIAESGEKHVLGVWQGATENTTVVKGCWKIWWTGNWICNGGIWWCWMDRKRCAPVWSVFSVPKWKCGVARFTSGGM